MAKEVIEKWEEVDKVEKDVKVHVRQRGGQVCGWGSGHEHIGHLGGSQIKHARNLSRNFFYPS